MHKRPAAAALGVCLLVAASCSRPASRFSEAAARAHVDVLAGVIGSRPAGTEANRRAREYIVSELRRGSFDVRVQQADAVRPELGQTARVSNIIAVKAGGTSDAIALVSHYDSPGESPGAADDALGVAVCLEAGRVLAARARPTYTLVVAITDAEEIGMMGAAALIRDPVVRRTRAYLNFEAVGASGPSLLFETGPGNGWLVKAWARFAPLPAGASYATEIYRRLPNDTDFTILKRAGIPGLNFAPIGNSYVYHTSRDTPDRLAPATLRQTGENAVAIVEGLDRIGIPERSSEAASFVAIRGVGASAFGSRTGAAMVILALVAGAVAWIRLLVFVGRRFGLVRWLVTAVWTFVGLLAVVGAMVGAAALLRGAREVYHPWYAHPGRFFVLLAASGWTAAWLLILAGRILPDRFRGRSDPAIAWSLTLPVWIALTGTAQRFAPGTAPLGAIPLLAAGALLAVTPLQRDRAIRVSSLLSAAAAAAVWLETSLDLVRFAVPTFGRLPIVTPLFVFPALMCVAGIWLVPPPLIALSGVAGGRARRSVMTVLLLVVLVVASVSSLAAPAYTVERPEHRSAVYVHDLPRRHAFWVVGGNEPLDRRTRGVFSQPPWLPAPVDRGLQASYPIDVRGPFLVLKDAEEAVALPAVVRGVLGGAGDDVDVEVTVVPRQPLVAVVFGMPPGVSPLETNLPGVVRQGRWRAVVAAPPLDPVSFRARFQGADRLSVGTMRVLLVAAGLPGGSGWQKLPAWLPAERTAWSARSVFIVPVELRPEEPQTRPRVARRASQSLRHSAVVE